MLKAKAGSGPGGLDMAAVKRAEHAMETLKSEFADWLADDVSVLVAARKRYGEQPDAGTRAALLRAAHDIKGQAATFNYPLIARVAGSLSRMIGDLPESTALPLSLIDAHVNAILVIHKQAMQDTGDKIALALCTELDARVNELLPK
jgi:chemotaxis protein histidine kinase CheA